MINNKKKIKFLISIIIFIAIYFLFIIDMIYYYKDDSYSFKKAINDMFQWFSVWSLFYTFFISIILFFYEIIYIKKKKKNR